MKDVTIRFEGMAKEDNPFSNAFRIRKSLERCSRLPMFTPRDIMYDAIKECVGVGTNILDDLKCQVANYIGDHCDDESQEEYVDKLKKVYDRLS
jgi:hypothetical protein